MRFRRLVWSRVIEEKLASRHGVEKSEVKQTLDYSRVWLVERGEREGEDVYMALGQTEAGRYLAVLFIWKRGGDVLVLSARDMSGKERRRYGRK